MIDRLKEYNEIIYKKKYIINLLHWELMIEVSDKGCDYLIDIINDKQVELFRLQTSNEYMNLLEQYLNDTSSDINSDYYKIQKNNYDNLVKSKRVPEDFLKRYNEVCSKANKVWEIAKKENNYSMYKPYLEEVIDVTKKYYSYLEPDMNLYDAMLNAHERGITQDIIDKLFDELKLELIPLIKKVKNNNDITLYTKEYSSDELINCAKFLLDYIGFDLSRGSLGIYPHGFMEKMSNNDIRIAFSHTNNPISFVSTIIHEGGHGIFEQNMSKDISKEDIDLYALHESQSRFYENVLGRNINFWIPIYDKVKELLRLDLSIEEFVSKLNYVTPSFIRTEADELTYCLHIIIRYEIEKEIFNNNIDIDSLPSLWNKKMKEYLGLEVESDSLGLMQDMHWSEGAFGYFPSYLIGNIYDGMYIESITSNLGNIDEILSSGNIKEITKYLNDNIHIHGSSYTGIEVINRMCNKNISVKPLINYFKNKYE